jgi:hypothetical protein
MGRIAFVNDKTIILSLLNAVGWLVPTAASSYELIVMSEKNNLSATHAHTARAPLGCHAQRFQGKLTKNKCCRAAGSFRLSII